MTLFAYALTAKLIATGAIAVAALVGIFVVRRVAAGHEDPYARFQLRRTARSLIVIAALIAVGFVWGAFASRGGFVLGLFAAGLAFAGQEVVGAIAGWFNILSGHIFRVGDTIQMGGVQGDVIDLTPLRTKILEMGSPPAHTVTGQTETWVHARQLTGRIVSVSNKMTFTEPVYNYSATIGFIWDELTMPISYRSDWKAAERIMREEAEDVSSGEGPQRALEETMRRYPLRRGEVEPRVFVRATDNWVEISARYVVELDDARMTKDLLTRRLLDRFAEAGVELSSATFDITVRRPQKG